MGRVENRFHPALPHQTGHAVFPHPAFRCPSLQGMRFLPTSSEFRGVPGTVYLTAIMSRKLRSGQTYEFIVFFPQPHISATHQSQNPSTLYICLSYHLTHHFLSSQEQFQSSPRSSPRSSLQSSLQSSL
jgi:hypothetical protein